MLFMLWILAVILVVAGIVQLFRGQLLWGIVLIIVGLPSAGGSASSRVSSDRRGAGPVCRPY